MLETSSLVLRGEGTWIPGDEWGDIDLAVDRGLLSTLFCFIRMEAAAARLMVPVLGIDFDYL